MEAEKALLGGIMLDNSSIDTIASKITPGDFSDRKHALIYGAMLELREEDLDIDAITLGNKLRTSGYEQATGGTTYLAELVYGLPHFINPNSYIKLIKKDATKRKMLNLANAVIAKVNDDDGSDPKDILTFLDFQTETLRSELDVDGAGFQHIAQVAPGVIQEIEDLSNGINPGIETGLWLFDTATGGGIRPSELWVIVAKTGQGKSGLMKQIAHNMASSGTPVAIITAEMSNREVFYRFLAPESGVPAWTVNKHLDPKHIPKLEDGIKKLSTLPIWMNDKTINIFDIRPMVRNLVRTQGIKVLFVDYVQLLEISAQDAGRKSMTRTEELAKISRMLKQLAQELEISIIELAQFNRQADAKFDVHGNAVQSGLEHLAGSAGLGQDANMVLIIDMDDYVQGQPERKCTFRIVKFRRMPPFPLPYIFDGNYYTFREAGEATKNDEARPLIQATHERDTDISEWDNDNPTF